jgi:RNA polymerase sigma factor (sigma-70 family)
MDPIAAALLARERALVTALCRRLLGDAALAEDAAQEAMLRALIRPATAPPVDPGPLLRAIAVNVCRYWRRQRRRDGRSLDALLAAGAVDEPRAIADDPADRAAARETAAHVRAAVAALPPGQRAAVSLHYFAGLSLIEAAAILGTEAGAVKTRLHKARRTLGLTLEPLREGPPRPAAPPLSASVAVALLPPPCAPRPRLFRLEVDVEGLTDALLGFVRDASRASTHHPAIHELRSNLPSAVPVLESMVLDGVRQRRHVAELVRALFGVAA